MGANHAYINICTAVLSACLCLPTLNATSAVNSRNNFDELIAHMGSGAAILNRGLLAGEDDKDTNQPQKNSDCLRIEQIRVNEEARTMTDHVAGQ